MAHLQQGKQQYQAGQISCTEMGERVKKKCVRNSSSADVEAIPLLPHKAKLKIKTERASGNYLRK
jgi:hypothetical protein